MAIVPYQQEGTPPIQSAGAQDGDHASSTTSETDGSSQSAATSNVEDMSPHELDTVQTLIFMHQGRTDSSHEQSPARPTAPQAEGSVVANDQIRELTPINSSTTSPNVDDLPDSQMSESTTPVRSSNDRPLVVNDNITNAFTPINRPDAPSLSRIPGLKKIAPRRTSSPVCTVGSSSRITIIPSPTTRMVTRTQLPNAPISASSSLSEPSPARPLPAVKPTEAKASRSKKPSSTKPPAKSRGRKSDAAPGRRAAARTPRAPRGQRSQRSTGAVQDCIVSILTRATAGLRPEGLSLWEISELIAAEFPEKRSTIGKGKLPTQYQESIRQQLSRLGTGPKSGSEHLFQGEKVVDKRNSKGSRWLRSTKIWHGAGVVPEVVVDWDEVLKQ